MPNKHPTTRTPTKYTTNKPLYWPLLSRHQKYKWKIRQTAKELAWIFTPDRYDLALYLSQPKSIEIKDLEVDGLWTFAYGSLYLPLRVRKNIAALNDLKRKEEDGLGSHIDDVMELCGKISKQLFHYLWNCNYYLALEELDKPEKEKEWYNSEGGLVTEELEKKLSSWWCLWKVRGFAEKMRTITDGC